MKDVKERLAKYSKLLPLNKSISIPEAEQRAGMFLEAMAYITEVKHLLGEEKIKSLSIQTVTYAQELSKGTAKTMTENKVTAEASDEYIKAREDLEGIDNDMSYLRAMYEVFNNGHIFYRNQCKDLNG